MEVGRKRENLIFFVRQEKLVNLVSRPKNGLDMRFTSIFCAARKTKFLCFLPTSCILVPGAKFLAKRIFGEKHFKPVLALRRDLIFAVRLNVILPAPL